MTTPQGMLELAEWARAAAPLFPSHADKFEQIAQILSRQAAAPHGREALARKLCELDGWNPDATGNYGVKVIREGKLTDTGHDTRRGHIEDLTAPPMWQMYVSKAQKLQAFLALTPAVAPDGAGWRTDMGNAPKDRPFLVYWHKSNIFGVLEWYNGHWEDQDGDEVFAFSRWCLFELPDDLPALAQAQEPGEERKSLVDPGEVDISALRPERSGARG